MQERRAHSIIGNMGNIELKFAGILTERAVADKDISQQNNHFVYNSGARVIKVATIYKILWFYPGLFIANAVFCFQFDIDTASGAYIRKAGAQYHGSA